MAGRGRRNFQPRSGGLELPCLAGPRLRLIREPPPGGGRRAHAARGVVLHRRPAGRSRVNWFAALLVVAGYLLGSLSFALLLVRWRTGTDIRKEGSGNAGATNVLRAHGKALGLAVALLDVAKGSAAVLLVRLVTADPRYAAAAGFA